MEPTLEQQGSGYKITWASKNVEMRVRNIKPKGFKAEVAVLLNNMPVHRSNPTLDSVSGMDAFARKLNRRRPLDDYGVDWEQLVEDLSGIVIDTYRTGEKEVQLKDVSLGDKLLWRVDNLLVEGDISIVWADGGTGKSMFALFLSTLVQQGYMSTEHGLIVEPGNVLYLDYETTSREIATRSRLIQAGLGIDAVDSGNTSSRITYRKCDQPFTDEVDRIRDIIFKHSIDVVIVDSMGMACGDLNDMDAVLQFFRELRKLTDTTVLVVTHANRQGTFFGSAYTHNSGRLIWEAKRSGSNDSGMDFSLFCRKANNVPMQPPQSWSVDFSDGKAVYVRKDVFETEDAGGLSYMNLVYSILKEDGESTRDYLKERIKELKPKDERGKDIPIERTERNVDTAISKQKSKGAVEEVDGLLKLVKEREPEWQEIA